MFEQEAAVLTRKFGIDEPQDTIGYRLILNALQDAYRRGTLATVTSVETGAGEDDRMDATRFGTTFREALNRPMPTEAGGPMPTDLWNEP